jgi:hypothetical protein
MAATGQVDPSAYCGEEARKLEPKPHHNGELAMFHLLQQFLVRRPIRRMASLAAAATALAVLAPFFATTAPT